MAPAPFHDFVEGEVVTGDDLTAPANNLYQLWIRHHGEYATDRAMTRVKRTSAQAIANNTNVQLTWQGIDYDTRGWWSGGTPGQISIPDGYGALYEFGMHVGTAETGNYSATPCTFQGWITWTSGNDIIHRKTTFFTKGQAAGVCVGGLIFVGNDAAPIKFWVRQNSGETIQIDPARTGAWLRLAALPHD